jgi:protein-S-isoprenylcysteine O-methyltransferase Ste14
MRQYWFPKHYSDEVQRLRVPLGFVLVTVFLLRADPTAFSMAAGLPLSLSGLLLRGWAAGHLAKNEALATSGPFAHMRNPLYAGTAMVAMGLAAAARDVWFAVLFAVVFALVYLPAMELEEQHLRKLFPSYREYASRVPMLVPSLRRADDSGNFQWKLYKRNQEYQALLGWLAGAAYLLWRSGITGY